MSYSLFISDLHLDGERPQHVEALGRLLDQHAGKADALYVLGDLFESWVGDDDDSEFNQSIEQLFRRFAEQGSALWLMHGNRDFAIGDEYAARCGGRLLAEYSVVDLYGQQALLLHGDSLCTRDVKYQQFRAMARDPTWQAEMRAKPLAERRMMAQFIRMQSKQNHANRAENIVDVTEEEVVKALEQAGVQCMIHGHTHRPAVHQLDTAQGPATRYVLGDWQDTLWLITADGEGIRLSEQAL